MAKKDNNYYKAAGYYQRHSDANTLRKLQMFLSGRGYYDGDYDGLFGTKTYDAIRRYQQDNHLTVDGMWGEDTNSVHRVLNAVNAPYRKDASGSSGAHAKKGQGVNTGMKYVPSAIKTDQDMYRAINQLSEKVYADGGRWFWSDAEDATQWRTFLHKTPKGRELLNEFYDAYEAYNPREKGSAVPPISYRKLTNEQGKAVMKRSVAEGKDKIAPVTFAALSTPLALANPLSTLAGLAGASAGGAIGRQVGRDLYDDDDVYTTTKHGLMGTPASFVMPAQARAEQQGDMYGNIIGAMLGSTVGGYASKNFDFNGFKTGMGDMFYNRPTTIQRIRVPAGTYTAQTRINGRYGPNTSVTPGSFTGGIGNSWGAVYENVGDALRANPGASIGIDIITPRWATFNGTPNTFNP